MAAGATGLFRQGGALRVRDVTRAHDPLHSLRGFLDVEHGGIDHQPRHTRLDNVRQRMDDIELHAVVKVASASWSVTTGKS